MGVLEIRAEIHCDLLKSVQPLHTPFSRDAPGVLSDRSSSARCCPVPSPDRLGHLPRKEGVGGNFMDRPRGSLVAQLEYENIDWSAG